jgi:hypothetical protein
MRSTFFRHFCAGETLAGVGEVVRQYELSGVRCIFDYSVEVRGLDSRNGLPQPFVKKLLTSLSCV